MPEKLKDIFFTQHSIDQLAGVVADVYPAFDRRRFMDLLFDAQWEGRELKTRMHHTAACLRDSLPADYPAALKILRQVAPHIQGFEALTFPDFVEQFGLEHRQLSLAALAYFTRFGSAEFAIRPFLEQDPQDGMRWMRAWAQDQDPAVRRLASEGCRPRLPWGRALTSFRSDPAPILPVLELLKDDPDESVRRSVANNLNDISKDHPDLVLSLCERWTGYSAHRDWIIKHACRGLLKAGDPRALALFGFADPAQVSIDNLQLSPAHPRIGETLEFSFYLQLAGEAQRSLRLEYAIDYQKARGGPRQKIFQIHEKDYAPGAHLIRRQRPLRDYSTRTHYPGEHKLTLIVNGAQMAQESFILKR